MAALSAGNIIGERDNRTSMSGVMFISIIGSAFSFEPVVCIAMRLAPKFYCAAPEGGGWEMKPTRAKPARCMVNTAPPMHL